MKGPQKKSHEVAEFQRRVLKERREGREGVGIDAIPLELVQSNPTFISPFVRRSFLSFALLT